jgi:hypothetical protein
MLEISGANPYDRLLEYFSINVAWLKYIQLLSLRQHYIDELVNAPCENNHLSLLGVTGDM